ncbi:MAG: hypothetical protein QGF21_04915 [Vicinamibacterales bacterium]|nr:hypothetical protein [Acidobacteriota bacterium]MDP7473243.1 hypothetical protein [Vicinamibacterales bacterium]MDP7671270.1 hypothetical protein [Vicinamibacterales bacterium]HJO38836.1 hypothetical protein [Vicinamibacterales bacterium]
MSDPAEYCRAVEAYLCRQNHGHLIRLVGPAFELVRGWAAEGVPLKVVMRGIDARVARREAKGGRRRALQIEFCEDDVLRALDEWRLAVGPTMRSEVVPDGAVPDVGVTGRPARGQSLPKHLTGVMSRLTGVLMAPEPWPGLHAAVDRTVRALDPLGAKVKTVRGAARAALLEELRALDDTMMQEVEAGADEGVLAQARAAAGADLETYRDRMTEPAFVEATSRAVAHHLRARSGLPRLSTD